MLKLKTIKQLKYGIIMAPGGTCWIIAEDIGFAKR